MRQKTLHGSISADDVEAGADCHSRASRGHVDARRAVIARADINEPGGFSVLGLASEIGM